MGCDLKVDDSGGLPRPHTQRDFAERNGFCIRSFFIIKLTVSTPSSRPRLLPREATPL